MSIVDNITRGFKHKNFRDFFFWQFLSFSGTWIQNTAQSWLIYRLTGSAFFLGLVGFAGSLPALILAPISGVTADRFKRKDVLLITQILCVIQGIILSALFFSGTINKWHILILAIFLGIANSFDVTARQTFIPLLVTKGDLLNAIALNSSMFNAARIIGPALAGILISKYSEGICFVLNVLSYLPFIVFLFLVKVKEHEVSEFSSSLAHLKEGVLFAWNTSPIRHLLLVLGTYSLWGMSFITLMPIFSDQILHRGAKGLGILMGASGIGSVIGALFLASRQKILGIKKLIALCGILSSVCIFIFAFSKIYLLSILLLIMIGFCSIIIISGSNTAMQAMSPDSLRGRIVGLFSMMFMGIFPLGSLTVGYLAHILNTPTAVSIGASICFLVAIYFFVKVPKLTKQAKELMH
ncbi:MAG: hypothetical protein A3F80_05020 [Candidatus Melainabacteria bacterium RIFCSPLOWO2_12_FULL_35_11]|nr:MAG: hypothetical protein A3F80_05020 [Candidatus Melainabacteria bacterium RIFCSPLOWO2_12_FULL_35_11]